MKIYKIYNKETKEYEGFGYKQKKSWFKNPIFYFRLNSKIYEIHVFELKQTQIIEL